MTSKRFYARLAFTIDMHTGPNEFFGFSAIFHVHCRTESVHRRTVFIPRKAMKKEFFQNLTLVSHLQLIYRFTRSNYLYFLRYLTFRPLRRRSVDFTPAVYPCPVMHWNVHCRTAFRWIKARLNNFITFLRSPGLRHWQIHRLELIFRIFGDFLRALPNRVGAPPNRISRKNSENKLLSNVFTIVWPS